MAARAPHDWMVRSSRRLQTALGRAARSFDGDDLRLLVGVLALSLGVLWGAAVLGLALFVFRSLGGV